MKTLPINPSTFFITLAMLLLSNCGSPKAQVPFSGKYPEDMHDLYEREQEQEKKNIIAAHVKKRTRYLHHQSLSFGGSGFYTWIDSFNTEGQKVLHRYLAKNGSLINTITYKYDDHGKEILEQETPGERATLGETKETIVKYEYTYDEKGNVLKSIFSYDGHYGRSWDTIMNTYDSYGNLIKATDKNTEEENGIFTPDRNTKREYTYSIVNGQKRVEQIAENKARNESAKFIHFYDMENFLLTDERLISKNGGDFSPDRKVEYEKDEQGRLSKEVLYGKKGNVFAQRDFTYDGDTMTMHYITKPDASLEEIKKYVRNQVVYYESIVNVGTTIEKYEFNEHDLLVKKTKQIKTDFLLPADKDEIVYEYYK